MDSSWIKPLLDWIAAHPGWSGVIVVLTTFSESLVVIGFFVPGVIMLFGAGALIAVGSLDLWLTLGCAAFGATVGDVFSFWLGRHFKERLRTVWPFRRYPQLISRGETFFARHGGKSVLFGRFVGPLRAIVPAIAGMVGMTPLRFIIIDSLSAIAWAPAYIVPGIVFAASLGLAAAVATRLAVLLAILVVLLWLTVWLVRHAVSFLQPRTARLVGDILNWSRGHRLLGGIATAVLDPYQSETRGLLLFALMLLGITVLIMTVIAVALNIAPESNLDHALHSFALQLSAPFADHLMAGLGGMGGGAVNATVVAGVGVWWSWRRNWPAVVHWLSAISFGVVLIVVYHAWQVLLYGRHVAASPGGTMLESPVMAAMVYGFVSVVVARELPAPWRWAPYLAASLIVLSVALAHLYFGLQLFSELLVTLTVAFVWLVLLGVAYRRHNPTGVRVTGTVTVALAVFAAAAVWQITQGGEVAHRPVTGTRVVLTPAEWWREGWRTLPSQRVDFLGKSKQPFTVQWQGDAGDVKARLLQRGWSFPPPLTAANSLLWLKPKPSVGDLPVLPQVHSGRYERVLLVHNAEPGRQLVLRLWKADATLKGAPGGGSLWVGYVAYQIIKEPLIFLSLPLPDRDFDAPLRQLQNDLRDFAWREVQRDPAVMNATAQQIRWDGGVLLIRPAATGGNGAVEK